MSTRYGRVPFVEMADIDSMARFSVPYVNIFGADCGSRGGSHPRCPAEDVGHAQPWGRGLVFDSCPVSPAKDVGHSRPPWGRQPEVRESQKMELSTIKCDRALCLACPGILILTPGFWLLTPSRHLSLVTALLARNSEPGPHVGKRSASAIRRPTSNRS